MRYFTENRQNTPYSTTKFRIFRSNSIQILVKSEKYRVRSAIKNYHGHEEIVQRFKVCTHPYPERGSANERRPSQRAGPEKEREFFKWAVKTEMSFPMEEPATKKKKGSRILPRVSPGRQNKDEKFSKNSLRKFSNWRIKE